jgi:hypothetical protein
MENSVYGILKKLWRKPSESGCGNASYTNELMIGYVHSPTEALIFKNNTHTGPIRGLDFNPVQGNLFASGAVNGEVHPF